MPGILIEEHKHYGIDCKTAIWATDEIKKTYNESGVNVLSDADFAISRKALRNRLKKTGVKLIESVDVVNIDEWNHHAVYGQFPIMPIDNQET